MIKTKKQFLEASSLFFIVRMRGHLERSPWDTIGVLVVLVGRAAKAVRGGRFFFFLPNNDDARSAAAVQEKDEQ